MMKDRAINGFAIVVVCAGAALAQRPADVVHWSAKAAHVEAHGETVSLSATIQPGWHVYAPSQQPGGPTPMTVKIPAGQPFVVDGKITEGATLHRHDLQFDMETVFFMNAAHLTVPVRVSGSDAGKPIPLDVRFQACNDSICLPPTTVHLVAQGGESAQ